MKKRTKIVLGVVGGVLVSCCLCSVVSSIVAPPPEPQQAREPAKTRPAAPASSTVAPKPAQKATPAPAGTFKPPKEVVPAAPKPRPAPKETAEPTVYITETGEKYHSAGCSYLSKSRIPITLKEAKSQGYGPCSKCSPPQ